MRMYFGWRDEVGAHVYWWDTSMPGVRPRALPMRHDLRNYSPDGPQWGHCGSGPAQLALALAAHASGDDGLALAYHQMYKVRQVAMIQVECWALSERQILDVLQILATELPERLLRQREEANDAKAIQQLNEQEGADGTLIV